jgi:hypothetical protein
VIVLDYDVTDSIFHHMYGDKANYQGYMSKFLSSYPFTFSISQVAYTKVYEFIERKCNITQNEMSKLALGNVTMNTIYFPQLLNSLSVRDIAHALDGIEQQLIPDKKITIYGQEYSTDVPIIWLIALLKRLRGNISESVIYKGLLSLKTETMLNTLDIMLLGGSLSTGRYFSFGNDVFGIHHVDWNNPNGDKRVFVKNNMMVPNIDVDMHVAIQNAISKSFKYVADVVPG